MLWEEFDEWERVTGHRHEHLHLYADGLRRFVHVHDYPTSGLDPLAARPHRHENGRHSHPHDHRLYRPLPENVKRRPIVPTNAQRRQRP